MDDDDTHVTVRQATLADVGSILSMFGELDDLHARHLPHVFAGSAAQPRAPELVANLLVDANCAVFVAELAQRVVGMVVVRLRETSALPRLVDRRFGDIGDLFVDADARRRGVGRRLIETAEAWARGAGASSIELGVYEFNEPAIRLYTARGYSTEFRRMRRGLENAG